MDGDEMDFCISETDVIDPFEKENTNFFTRNFVTFVDFSAFEVVYKDFSLISRKRNPFALQRKQIQIDLFHSKDQEIKKR